MQKKGHLDVDYISPRDVNLNRTKNNHGPKLIAKNAVIDIFQMTRCITLSEHLWQWLSGKNINDRNVTINYIHFKLSLYIQI